MLSYTLRDLWRNPRRTLASLAGVVLAVGLFSGIAFFVDSSAATMTAHALAPVALDMQVDLSAPLASPLNVTQTPATAGPLAAGETSVVHLALTNTSSRPATGIVVRDQPPQGLIYVPGTTTVAGRPVPDTAGGSPLFNGLAIGDLAANGQATLDYSVKATAGVPSTLALAFAATVVSKEQPAPSTANAPSAPNVDILLRDIKGLSGVSAVDRLGVVDLPAGSLRAGTTTLAAPLRVFAFDPSFLSRYSMVRVTSGSFADGTALLSADASRQLGGVTAGAVELSIPGRAAPLTLPVSGIADFSRADPLFASRSADNQGEFATVPNVLVVTTAVFEQTILPALRVDAVAATPVLKTAPVVELDVQLDRSALAVDPTAAAIRTAGLRRSIERIAPGQVAVIDNLTDALTSARGDAILAKVLFIFLGLPGVLLAAYLSRYAGSLLAQAQRRERATLRARGAGPAQLLQALTYNTVAIGIVGSVLGLALGFAGLLVLFGRAALTSASSQSYLLSAGLALAAGVVTTAVALYLPGRRALTREVSEERREMEAEQTVPGWLRLRLDLALLFVAAVVGTITYLAGGYKPTAAEGQSVSLSFYVLLAPLLGWIGASLLGVRLLLGLAHRLPDSTRGRFGSTTAGTLRRSLRRRSQALASGVIAISLAVAFGVSLTLFIGTYQVEKLNDARFVVGSDLRVTPSVVSRQPSSFASSLQVPGVSAVSPVLTGSAIVGTDKRALAAVDPASLQKVASLPDSFFIGSSAAAVLSALRTDPSGILVSDELARTFNVQPGDPVNVRLTNAAGKLQPATFHAIGRFKNFPGFPQGIDLVANLGYYQAATGATAVDFFLVKAAQPDDASVASLAATLRSGAVPVLVDTTTTAVNRDQSSLASLNLRGLGRLESLYTVLMSAAGVAIFTFGLLLQRRKEYVTMRALGMRMSQVRTLVLGEAGTVAGLSLVLGSLVGLGMAILFVQILTPLFTIPPTSLAVPAAQLGLLGVAVIGATAAAALVAGSTLRRLSLVELLREE
ncbi:MAG TPA: FtsX-like permease family protein [Candidatus Dormibacteraeota bacterium]